MGKNPSGRGLYLMKDVTVYLGDMGKVYKKSKILSKT